MHRKMYGPISLLGLIALASHVTNALPAAGDDSGISAQQMEDAFPPRDPANTTNWYGTSLYGWE
jgi:hypothetical protein